MPPSAKSSSSAPSGVSRTMTRSRSVRGIGPPPAAPASPTSPAAPASPGVPGAPPAPPSPVVPAVGSLVSPALPVSPASPVSPAEAVPPVVCFPPEPPFEDWPPEPAVPPVPPVPSPSSSPQPAPKASAAVSIPSTPERTPKESLVLILSLLSSPVGGAPRWAQRRRTVPEPTEHDNHFQQAEDQPASESWIRGESSRTNPAKLKIEFIFAAQPRGLSLARWM